MSSIVAVTPDNQGPIVNIISWILLVCTCLATLAKVWSKWSLTRKLEADDFYLTGAMVRCSQTPQPVEERKLTVDAVDGHRMDRCNFNTGERGLRPASVDTHS